MFDKIPLLIHMEQLFPNHNPSKELNYFLYEENLDPAIKSITFRRSWYSSTIKSYLEDVLNYQVFVYANLFYNHENDLLEKQYGLTSISWPGSYAGLNIKDINQVIGSKTSPFVIFNKIPQSSFIEDFPKERRNGRQCLGIVAGNEGFIQTVDIEKLVEFSRNIKTNKNIVSQ
jgi:hypothetical protein